MPEFNLAEQGWLPCLAGRSQQVQEISLRETLARAHEIRELYDPSPLVTVALHRLLLAVLHRNFGPASFSAWRELWRRGSWDADALHCYFDKWRHRFDLFDAERPFYQVPPMTNDKGEKVEPHPVALLAHEAATGNNATLFDHSFKASAQPLTPAAAARYLIARQAFSVGGGVSQPFNLSHATLARGLSVLALGENLFETLALNLLPYNESRPIEHKSRHEPDLPAWEQETPATPDKNGTLALGYLDYLTWQSRRIYLLPADGPAARYCQLQQNLKLSEQVSLFDPFKCYQRKDDKEPFQPKSVSASRALWRDSHTLFEEAATDTTKTRRPALFNHLAQVEKARRYGEIAARPRYAFAVYGFATEPGKAASVIYWSRERLPLPLAYLAEPQLVNELKGALGLADECSSVLHQSIYALAKLLLAPASDDAKARQPASEDISKLLKTFSATDFYWARLDHPFTRLLTDLPADFRYNQEHEDEPRYAALRSWAHMLEQTARGALAQTTNSLSGSARELKAAAEAWKTFERGMGRIRQGNDHFFPQTKTTGGNL